MEDHFQSSSEEMENLSSCGGCGEDVGDVHRCPVCCVSMHTWCGLPEGPEGFGQKVLCPKCMNHERPPTAPSASPLIAAFGAIGRSVPTRSESTNQDSSVLATQVPVFAADEAVRIGHNAAAQQIQLETSGKPRKRQDVTTIAKRRAVVKWMQEQNDCGEKELAKAAVDHFPDVFQNAASRESDRKKAARWWAQRESLLNLSRGALSVSKVTSTGRKVVAVKALTGRGRHQSEWAAWLYPELLSEFTRLRKAGLQFDMPLLRQLAIRTIETSDGRFDKHSRDKTGILLTDRLTPSWIQYFMEKNRIVLRAQTGKKQVSEKKIKEIRSSVATHLGRLQRGFGTGDLDESAIENVDETHFVIDFDTGKTLGFVGEQTVKYADVVSGGEGMTMVVRLTGGPSGRVMPPMMILQNANANYPIRGVPDDIPGVCYRTGKKGWMDKRVFREFLRERRAVRADPNGKKKTIFLDNCGGHLAPDECEEELRLINADLKFLPPNSTDLCQPADSFVISKLKAIWARKWNAKKLELILDSDWQDSARNDGAFSGKLKNPGKTYFLKLAAECVQELNQLRDKNGLSYARKAMIRCGMSLNTDGSWTVDQLYPHLQEIVKEYPDEFAGRNTTPSQS